MAVELTPLFIPGGFGGPELVIILLIAVLLFGANKIPKLARSTGQALGEFQRGREELEEEIQNTGSSAQTETDTTQTQTQTQADATQAEPANGSTNADADTTTADANATDGETGGK